MDDQNRPAPMPTTLPTRPHRVSLRFDMPRPPHVVAAREQAKRTLARFACQCGAELYRVKIHTLQNQGHTTRRLVEQAHRKHRRESGCEQGIA